MPSWLHAVLRRYAKILLLYAFDIIALVSHFCVVVSIDVADDPVTTCRKILRWRQCLEMPAETKAQLSPECIDFLSCLLAGPESRIGSSKNGSEVESGFKQVVQHPWFRGFDWDGLREKEGPLLPSGSREFPELLEYLK